LLKTNKQTAYIISEWSQTLKHP